MTDTAETRRFDPMIEAMAIDQAAMQAVVCALLTAVRDRLPSVHADFVASLSADLARQRSTGATCGGPWTDRQGAVEAVALNLGRHGDTRPWPAPRV